MEDILYLFRLKESIGADGNPGHYQGSNSPFDRPLWYHVADMGKYSSSGYGAGAALLAAFFFGLSAPASKLLLAKAGRVIFAGVFCRGGFAGLFGFTSV